MQPVGQGLACLQCLGHGPAADSLHRVVQGAVGADAQLVDRHDAGVLQLAGNPRLAQETDDGERRGAGGTGGAGPGRGKRVAVHRELAEQLLEHDLATQVPVVHQQNPADPSAGQLGRCRLAAGICVAVAAFRCHREQLLPGFGQVGLVRPPGQLVVGGCPHVCIVAIHPAGFNG